MTRSDYLKENIITAEDLKDYVPDLSSEELLQLVEVMQQYPMSVPPYYLSLINKADKNDPIRKMCIPSLEEMDSGGTYDTSGEYDNTVIRGMQHKYRQTVLILSTSICAMYCRYCFRKRMVGFDNQETAQELNEIFAYIKEHEEVTNVLISGGDSFLNDNDTILNYLENLSSIEHLDFIRFGTKIPVVFPKRITEDLEFQSILRKFNDKKQIYVVSQFNHPAELTAESISAIKCLQSLGIIVNNQSVLLRGVNDKPEILSDLIRNLTRIGVSPYYIFQCRPVAGVKNQFQVPIVEGCDIIERTRMLQNGKGKSFRYALSNPHGKIEILGKTENGPVIFKYHQAKELESIGKIFTRTLDDDDCWID